MLPTPNAWYKAVFKHSSGRLTYFAIDGFNRANAKHRLLQHPDFLEFKQELERGGDWILNCGMETYAVRPVRAGLQFIVTVI